MKPRLLDLFCCEGGAAAGYAEAGFDVVGVDIERQRRYPFEFVQAEAVEYAMLHAHEFDAIHASPPCQRHSSATRLTGSPASHACFIGATRNVLAESGKPWVIENVVGAPLRNPALVCGASLGLPLRRHRLFESSFLLLVPACGCSMLTPQFKPWKPGAKPSRGIAVYGGTRFAGDRELRKRAMEMPWATLNGVNQAVPPRYTAMIGQQLLREVLRARLQEAA